jgi:hypothetical protein
MRWAPVIPCSRCGTYSSQTSPEGVCADCTEYLRALRAGELEDIGIEESLDDLWPLVPEEVPL